MQSQHRIRDSFLQWHANLISIIFDGKLDCHHHATEYGLLDKLRSCRGGSETSIECARKRTVVAHVLAAQIQCDPGSRAQNRSKVGGDAVTGFDEATGEAAVQEGHETPAQMQA